ncbi:MAG: hypothetical protein Q8L39_05135 [Burkholderiales bacterium]|nr:hypothetical protein [Burkholderiales bacterium]
MTTEEASNLVIACGKLDKVLNNLNQDIRNMLVLNQPNLTLLKMNLSANDALKNDTQYFLTCLEDASQRAGWWYRLAAKHYIKVIRKKYVLSQQGLQILKSRFDL